MVNVEGLTLSHVSSIEKSNMSSSGTHERHVATCHWVEIYGSWIRDKV